MLSKIKLFMNKILIRDKFNKLKKICDIDKTVMIFDETEIINCTKSRSKIVIKGNSAIRGHIFLYSFGNYIKIGKNCYIGEYSNLIIMDSLEIGNHVMIAHHVNIYDNNSHSTDINVRKNELQYIITKGHPIENIFHVKNIGIKIKDGAWIGMNSIILKGVVIGENAIVAAGSVVTKDVQPNTIVAGNPTRVIKRN